MTARVSLSSPDSRRGLRFRLFAGEFWMTLLTQIMIFGLLALSADLLLGHAGLFSLCHAAFFAVAAYTTAILQVRYGATTALAAPAGILAGTLLSFVFAFAVRTRGVYFILITLAFGYIIWGVAYRWASFTGGDNGVTNVPFPAIGGLRVAGATQYYYVVLVAVVLCALAYRMLVTSPFGLTLARHQVERVAHAQPRLRCRPPSLRGVRAVRASSPASRACSTSTTTASSIRSRPRSRSRSRPC